MKKLCFIFSCLLATASLSLSAQVNYTPVNVGSVNVGSSTTTTVTLSNGNGTYFDVNIISLSGEFYNAGTGTCRINYFQNPCTVDVVFHPIHGEAQFGLVIVMDAYGNIQASQLLQGTGIAPESSFSPGLESSIATIPNPTGITLVADGYVIVPTSGYGQAGNAVKASVYGLEPMTESSYHTGMIQGNLIAPRAWADQIGFAYFYDQQFEPYLFTRGSDTLLSLSEPLHLAGDLAGNLFITKPGDDKVYKETPFPRGPYSSSYSERVFATGSNVWTDWFGNVFVLNNEQLYKYIRQSDGTYVQTPVLHSLSSNLTIDGSGNIYGGIEGGTTLYKETLQPNGAYVLSPEIPIGISDPKYLTVDNEGNAFYSKLFQDLTPLGPRYESIMKEDFHHAPALTFASTALGSASTDSPRVVTITNHGNLPLQFSSVTYPADFPEASGATGECAAGTSLLAEESCTVSITFAPATPLTSSNTPAVRNEAVKIITNTLNATSTEQDIQVSGTATIGPAATPVFSVPAGSYNNTQTVAITDATPGVKIYYTINGTTPTTSSTKYTGPVAIRNSYTLKAIAAVPGTLVSGVASAFYNLVAAAPVFTPTGGTSATPLSVSISSASTGARIMYMISRPNQPGDPARYSYTGPITVNSTETIKAFAYATGYSNSPNVSQTYNIQSPPVAPAFSVPAGSYNNAQYVTITESVPGTTIYYTTNGSTPTTSSTRYTGPVGITNTHTLKAIAIAPGYAPSEVTSATYTLVAATPVITPVSNDASTGAKIVTISTVTTSAKIFFTLNGTNPTANSTLYTGPITINVSQTIRAVAAATGYTSSTVVTSSNKGQ